MRRDSTGPAWSEMEFRESSVTHIDYDFGAMNRNTPRRRNSQPDTTSPGFNHLHSDTITNDDFFTSFSSQYEHLESSMNDFKTSFDDQIRLCIERGEMSQ